MNRATWTTIGAALGGLSVVLGAFAAHGLKSRFAELTAGDFQPRDVFDLAVRYHAVHALALLFATTMFNSIHAKRSANAACWAFLVGILVFSGSLYLLGVTGVRWLGAITPIGGVSMIVGWVMLAVAGWNADDGRSLEVTPTPSG
jgi:uncharacterized membrane protein YgdD (TMEM256/DUF423 family)